jgi:membrane protease YdiL (CAAX protease family)
VRKFSATIWGDATFRALTILIATAVGWACGRVIEGLPFRALGWALHRGWVRDFLLGSLLGVASLMLAVLIITVCGGYSFAFASGAALPSALKTLVLAAGFFIIAGSAEEVFLRGYPFQTLLRSLPAWIPLVLTAVLFAAGHLGNPNIPPSFPFVSQLLAHIIPERYAQLIASFAFLNTMLAGVWLAVAYLRTRSLWFPIGVHWAWNWTLGALFGLPVSGITTLSRSALIPTTDRGPAWLTGGTYGVEGGAVCTLVLILSTVFIWRTRLVCATEEMKRLTSEEIPTRWRRDVDELSNLKTDEPSNLKTPAAE